MELSPCAARELLEAGPPPAGQRGWIGIGTPGGWLAGHRIEHEIEQFGLARDVPVERHRADAELVGDPPHRHRR
ncbi:MAG: hypothetical protein WKF51_07475 [Geodermatophilaceae bacterium]